MNFQDLFARYREMGAMAPQQPFDEQLFMRNQNMVPNSWTLSGDPLNMDLPTPPKTNNEGIKKDRLMFKLPSPNTFQPFFMSVEEEQKQRLSGDEEVEDLPQSHRPPLQQGWNLGLLKTNNSCKDYYKLTSKMLHTLIMGIKEFTDGEISPAWQIAQDRGHQKQSNLSSMFLQDVANKPIATSNSTNGNLVHDDSIKQRTDVEPSVDPENKYASPLKPAWNHNCGGKTPAPKELLDRSKDIDNVLELRKLFWRQIVPYTCLGASLDHKQDGEKKMKLVQDSRMKAVNAGGFGVNSDSYNCGFPESCQGTFKVAHQQVAQECDGEPSPSLNTPSIAREESTVNPPVTSSILASRESEFVEEDRIKEEDYGASRSHKEGGDHRASKMEYSVSFPEEEVDMQLEEEYANSREMRDKHPVKINKFSVHKGTRFEQERFSRSNTHAKETRFSVDGQILPIYDEGFEIVADEIGNPSGYHNDNLLGYKSSEYGSIEKDFVHRRIVHDNERRQHSIKKYKEVVVPPKSTTRSWCIVGGFSSRSRITSRNNHSHSQKQTKPLKV